MNNILFLQLPLSDHGYNYIDGNVQYAPALLTAYIKKNYAINASYLPDYFVNYASNNAIISYIKNSKVSIVCFTMFLWNCERVLDISKELKKGTNITIFVGGAEVHSDSFALQTEHNYVDLFVCGEGEYFFQKYFDNDLTPYIKIINHNQLFTQPEKEVIQLSEKIEPFSAGYLNVLHDKSIFYEYMRGCPYRCVYCNYSGRGSKVRELQESSLLNTIKLAIQRGVEEIYLLAPSLERSTNFDDLLIRIALINNGRLRLHSELRTEYIDQKRAQLLYKAGFRSLEIGLQTLNEVSLQHIGRKSNIDTALKGIDYLIEQQVELKIGIIPGLPADNPHSFMQTIDTLIERGYGDFIEFYPLMVLPGTKLRSMTSKYSLEYQQKPPYHILASNSFPINSIADLKEYLEEKTELYNFSHAVPDLIDNKKSLLYKGIFLDFEKGIDDQLQNISKDSYHFSFFLKSFPIDEEYLLIDQLIADRTYLYSLTFIDNHLHNEEVLATIVEKEENDLFFARLNLYNEWSESLSVRIFQIFTDFSLYEQAHLSYNFIEPFFIGTESLDQHISIVVSKRQFDANKQKIIEKYADYPEKISFIEEESVQEFYSHIGEYKKTAPFSIKNYSEMISCLPDI